MTPQRLGVVDVGSNSVRLFLCERVSESGPEGERFSTVTGLRRGAAPDGAIAPHARRPGTGSSRFGASTWSSERSRDRSTP